MFKVALCGPSGAGKSFIADILSRKFSFVHLSAGAICRDISLSLFGNDNRNNLNAVSEVVRRHDEQFFIRATMKQAESSIELPGCRGLVFDSARYGSDFVFLRRRGFRIWRIEAPDSVVRSRLLSRGQVYANDDLAHASETEYTRESYDIMLINDGHPEDHLILRIKDKLANSI